MSYSGPSAIVAFPSVIIGSILLALLAEIVALPIWLDRFWPPWLTLVLIYWCMMLPQRVGIGSAWLLGLTLDVARDTVLGLHALSLALVAYLTLNTHLRLRLFPVWQQALSVLLFALIDKLLVAWIGGVIGYPPRDAWFLAPAASVLIVWPLLVLILTDLSRQRRLDS